MSFAQPFQMHFHQKTAQFASSNGFKMLLILLIAHATCVQSTLTPDEIADAVNEAVPTKYCGKRLTEAMRTFCTPFMKSLILKQSGNPVKKSCKLKSSGDNKALRLHNIVFHFQWTPFLILTSTHLTWIALPPRTMKTKQFVLISSLTI